MLRRRSAQVAVLFALFLILDSSYPRTAHAAVLLSADVSLHSSSLIDFGFSSDTLSDAAVAAGSGQEICIPGDSMNAGCPPLHPATNIGGNGLGVAPPTAGATPLLNGEYIDLVPTPASIVVSIANGDGTSLHTGYAAGSYYLFSGLFFDTPETIVGVMLSLNNVSNLTVSDIGFTSNSVMLPLDLLNIGTVPGSGDTGTVTMTFKFQSGSEGGGNVPEPDVLALLALSVFGMTLVSWARARQ
jgi:hypothetical protein